MSLVDGDESLPKHRSPAARRSESFESPEPPRHPDKARVQEIIAKSKVVFRERLAKSVPRRAKKKTLTNGAFGGA
jgi:hypothetical protein